MAWARAGCLSHLFSTEETQRIAGALWLQDQVQPSHFRLPCSGVYGIVSIQATGSRHLPSHRPQA